MASIESTTAEPAPAPVQEAAPSALSTSSTQLDYLIANTQMCMLRPFSFFVSWQGVLTLAYRGFPAPLVTLKEQISDFYPSLPKENPGSKWPKTSLAALKDGRRLTPEQLSILIALCTELSGVFQRPATPKAQAAVVDKLALVVFECRSLERQVSKHEVPLAGPLDASDADLQEHQRVQAIMAEADDPNYWYHASRDGNRESHYKGGALGATLVHELACFKQDYVGTHAKTLPGILRKFRDCVEAALPDMYSWFGEESLHVTVRAII